MCDSLPQALLQQAQSRPEQTALRYKQFGIWQKRSWGELAIDVRSLAAALKGVGFGPADRLFIISEARAEALLLTLAAHWLGGSVSLLDPALDNREWLAGQSPEFAVVDGLEALLQVRVALPGIVVLLDKRGLTEADDSGVIDYARLLDGPAGNVADPRQSRAAAFVFPAVDWQPDMQLSHAVLLSDARQVAQRHALSSQDQALAARVFAASGQARYLLAPWLVAGFCLNFPEALGTRDNDRRELGPTLVLGTRESYARLELWVRERLPLPGSISHRLYRWAMAPAPGAVRRWLGYWLIRRPLLDVLGMSLLAKPLLAGDALTPQSEAFFTALGIRPIRLGAASQTSQPQEPADDMPHTPALLGVPS
ncbi:acyl-CoA synthetase [Pseudomonas amygdali pv. morsprunorum]|nr:AMP-binding protein [Pseudomonas amygdali]POY82008.1 acyl-CoA synthetase [Pseudomonas amygdali pv. morsprunorum]